jgi:predicted DNA-binding transcriptional regulator AlpA
VRIHHPEPSPAIIRSMDATQTKIIELLREVHLLAIMEVERLNLRISELENEHRQPTRAPIPTPAFKPSTPSFVKPTEMLNERQVADYVNMSLGSLRKWRLYRKGPKFVKLGRAIRYRRTDVETWLSSCPGPG